MPASIITNAGLAKIRTAAGSASQVAITHVAIGDGNGANYNPLFTQTALKREQHRVAIDTRAQIGTTSWWIRAHIADDVPAYDVREIGFFDAAGTLIALWADVAAGPRQTGGFTYLIDHVLDFSRADGLVIVDAPDNELFDHAVQNIHTHAIIADEQFKQRLLIRDLAAAQIHNQAHIQDNHA